VLGVRIRGSKLTLRPNIPPAWPGFAVTYRYRTSSYRIVVVRDSEAEGKDGSAVIELVDDGTSHEIMLRIPASSRELAAV